MMAITGGRLRTNGEIEAQLGAAGFGSVKATPLSLGLTLFEAA